MSRVAATGAFILVTLLWSVLAIALGWVISGRRPMDAPAATSPEDQPSTLQDGVPGTPMPRRGAGLRPRYVETRTGLRRGVMLAMGLVLAVVTWLLWRADAVESPGIFWGAATAFFMTVRWSRW